MSTLYEHYSANENSFYSFFDARWLAQTFTPSTAHKITSVKLKMRRHGLPGTLTVSIKATDDDGHPVGIDLCSGTTDADTLISDVGDPPGEWREITLGAGSSLSADTKYAIVVRAPDGDGSNCVHWRQDSVNPTYTGGNLEYSSNSGTSWFGPGFPGTDELFEEWGDPSVVLPTLSTNPASNIESPTVTLNGTLEDDGGEACDVRFQYGETSEYGINTEWQSGKESVVAFEQAITGLSPNTTYHFRAQAKNSAGTTSGADRTFTTLVATPTVTTDQATGRGAIAATVNGTLNQDGGEACECGFEWGPDTNYGVTTLTQSKIKDEIFAQVIRGLFPSTTYHFRAFATNSAGTGYGADRSFTTAPVMSRAYALAREEL